MKFKKMMLVTFVLLAILTLGAVSASEDVVSDDTLAVEEIDEVSVDASDDEIIGEESEPALESSDVEILEYNETIVPPAQLEIDVEDFEYDPQLIAVGIIYVEGPEEGNVTVNLDNARNDTISFYPGESRSFCYFGFDGLEIGTHNLTVTFAGDDEWSPATAYAQFEVFEAGEEEDDDNWIIDYNSDLISFRELATLSGRFDSGRLVITDSEGNVLFNQSVRDMEPNYGMKGYKYDQFRGYVVFKEDLNNTGTDVYDLTITYYDDENEIVESVNTTVYLDYTSYVTDDEIDLTDYNSTIFSFFVFNFMNNGSIKIEIIAGEDDDGEPFITSTFPVEDWMTSGTFSFTRQEFKDELDEGIYTVRVRYVPNDEDPDDHYVYYWKYTYFHDSFLTVVDNTKFRARMESESILDENSQFLVYCPQDSVGSTITINVSSEDSSYSFNYNITEAEGGKYINFTLAYLNITAPGLYIFNVYDENGENLIEDYEYEIGNPLHIPDVCVLGTVGLERTMVAVLYMDMTDDGRLVLADDAGVELFNETLTESYYHSLGYEEGYYILYSDLNPALTAGTYNITALYYINDILRLTKTAEIRIVERNYVEDNETGVGIELFDYYDHNLNDDEDLIALVAVPEYESGYVTVVLTNSENATSEFTFDEIDDDDGLPTFFVSLFDRDVEEGDYLVNVTYFDGDGNPVLSLSNWMAFYYDEGEDDDGPIDWIDFEIIGSDDGEATFEIGDNVHVASLWIPDNEEYGSTVATITITKNYELFATFVTSNMEPVYHEDKDADENQIYLDLTQFNDKDILEFNVDCFDENGRTWTFVIERGENNTIFHEFNSMIEYYVFYGNITTGDLNDPDLMGPHPNGDFMRLSIPWLYDATNVRFTAKAGETTLINKAFSDSEGEFNYDILGYSYAIPLENVNLLTLLPENETVTFTFSFGVYSATFNRVRIGDYVYKIVSPDDVARLYQISVTDDGIYDLNEIAINIAATDDANRQSIYIDIGGGQFNIYVNDEKVEGLGEKLLYCWIYESGVLDADPEELVEMGINEEVGINSQEFAELSRDEKVAILEDEFRGEFGSELELFRMTSYHVGSPELYLDLNDLGITESGTYTIRITHIPSPFEDEEPEPGDSTYLPDDCIIHEEITVLEVEMPVYLDVELIDPELAVAVEDISVGEPALIEIFMNDEFYGDVVLQFMGDTYIVGVNEGYGFCEFEDLPCGEYTVTVTSDADDQFMAGEANATFRVTKGTVLTVDEGILTYGDNPCLNVTLTDSDGNPIRASIAVTNDYGNYKYNTNADGLISVPVKFKPGEYNYTFSYAGNDVYGAVSKDMTVVVNKIETVISVEDIAVTYKENGNYTIFISDINGNPISGVTLSVNNSLKTLRYRTGSDGIANAPVTLKPSEDPYSFSVSFEGNSIYAPCNASSLVTVNRATVNLDAADLVVNYNDGSTFDVTVTDINGDAISGITVIFDNGVRVSKYRTDSNGVASAPISLKPANSSYTYRISVAGTSIYAAANITRTLTVEPAIVDLQASNTEITYKNGNLTARLTDANGNAISGATIKFTQGASTYKYRTDSDGVASAPIKLAPGDYNYTISYDGNSLYGPASTTASVKVNKVDLVLTAEDINMKFQDGTNYTARLTDANGNALAGVYVKLNRTGGSGTYKYKTDADGRISVPLNFKVGTYDFLAFVESSNLYNSASVATTVTISR